MTAYKIEYAACIKRQLRNIDKQYHPAIKTTIEDIATDPIKKSVKLKNPNLPERRSRKGDYRILFDIDKEKKLMEVKAIKHRSEVYE